MTNPSTQPSLFAYDTDAKPSAPRPHRVGETAVAYNPAREILTRATGFIGDYDFTLNPYSGCSFGCTYCYAAFFSRSKENRDAWGHWVTVKENAVEVMARRKPGALDGKSIYMSSVTDPYQPVERVLDITRGLLEIMADSHSPKLVIQTRSPDVVRDIDLFQRIEANGGRVQVNMTVTTDDEDVRRTFEPFCPSNPVRLNAVAQVQAAGIDACITMTPLLLVSSPHHFANSLLETGVQKFIAQSFHFQRGKFVASTREGALKLMADKLGCDMNSFKAAYMENYDSAFKVLKAELPMLGEGKDGFKPPF